MVDRPHWGWKNPKAKIGTAVRNLGQWPNGWTGDLGNTIMIYIIRLYWSILLIMTIMYGISLD